MTNKDKNRIKTKANRNLYIDQISILSYIAKQLNISDSQLLRDIVDDYISKNYKKDLLDLAKENPCNAPL